MRKAKLKQRLVDLYDRLGKAPGWKALEKDGIDEDHIIDHWDFLAEALDDAIGPKWRSQISKKEAEDLADEDDQPPRGHHFSVYVIKLSDKVMTVGRFAKENPKGTKGCLYVGQTWHSPDKRFENHQSGNKACPLVKKYGQRVLKNLTKDGQFETRAEAEREERRYARELRREGYRVWQK